MSFRTTVALICDVCGNRFPGREGESLTEVRERSRPESWLTDYAHIPAKDFCAQCRPT